MPKSSKKHTTTTGKTAGEPAGKTAGKKTQPGKDPTAEKTAAPIKEALVKTAMTKAMPAKKTATKTVLAKAAPTKQATTAVQPAKITPTKATPTKTASAKKTVTAQPTKTAPTKAAPTKAAPTKAAPAKTPAKTAAKTVASVGKAAKPKQDLATDHSSVADSPPLAAPFREDSAIPEHPHFFERPENFTQVNRSLPKLDGLGLACGTQKYVDDLDIPGLLTIKVLGSPHAHAEIKRIDCTEARRIPGVVAVFTWQDVPRIPHTTAGQGYPEPSPYDTFILDKKVRFVGDRVAIIAAETPQAAEEAGKAIEVEYNVLPAVFDPEKAMEKGAPIIHDEPECYVPEPIFFAPERNHCAHVETSVGDLKRGFAAADVVLERTYHSHYAQHTPLETHTCICYPDDNGRLVLRTSTQVPFHVRRITAQALQIPVKNIRVIKPRIGGGFGGKQEMLLEDVCALVTLRTGRPCSWRLTRAEEFMVARTRHPMVITVKSGVRKDGTLTAISMRVISNTGAYGGHALTVLSNGGGKVLPLYRCENVEFCGDAVYTNLPVAGAYRGYGAPQAAFALECQMDEMAAAIGMDPVKFRRQCHIREGETSPLFRALGEGREGVDMAITSCGLEECIDIGVKEISWSKKRGRPGTGVKRRGVGMCCLMQGSAIPKVDMGAVFMKMNEDGSFNMLLGATDLGTGSDTVLAQIAAETLGCNHDDIVVRSSDTDLTPFDVGAYASSTTYLSGGAVVTCAQKIRAQILAVAADMLGEPPEHLTLSDSAVSGRKKNNRVTFGAIALHALYRQRQFQIAAVASHVAHSSPPPFSAHFAEVEVDTETGEVKLLKYVAAVDCGTAINPQLADAQTQGGALNGMSFALTEEFIFDHQGRMLNPGFGHYKIWTSADLPDFKTFLVPTYEKTGPYGAKSVAEICVNGALPAIGNAIQDAVGVRLTRPPFTAEKVLRAIQQRQQQDRVADTKPTDTRTPGRKPSATRSSRKRQ